MECETCKAEREKLRLDYADEQEQRAAALRQVQALKDVKLSFWSRPPKVTFVVGLIGGAVVAGAAAR